MYLVIGILVAVKTYKVEFYVLMCNILKKEKNTL